MGRIGIIDYGMGNLHSVKNALDYLSIESFISSDKAELDRADALILPGVGAFPDAMQSLRDNGLVDFIRGQSEIKKLLGICLGMQLLLEGSCELHECEGLGLIRGRAVRLTAADSSPEYKIPHIGWNSLKFVRSSPLTESIPDGEYVYFVHSYKASLASESSLIAYAEYGECVPAVISDGKNVYGTQFHPEKSENTGLRMLKNFGGMIK